MRCNRKQLAKILGHDVKTIDKMVADGMPYVSRPDKKQGAVEWQFDTAQVLGWFMRDTSADAIKQAKSRLAQAKAGIKWLEYGQALGHLVEIDDVIDRIEQGDAIVKSRLLAVPGRLAHLVAIESDPDVIRRMLQTELEDALGQYKKPWRERG